MERFFVYFLLLSFFIQNKSFAKNHLPVVLVHGLTGWGRQEMKGFYYWGGMNDLQEDLKIKDYQVISASVGPLSSNYDRAIELYAQLKGTCADYGEYHAKKFGHARYGKCYQTPLLQKWDENHKIHLLGHSQGGQTIRAFLKLLKEGSIEELNTFQANRNELFSGNKDWIYSLTTVSTPNNGTSLTNILDVFIPTLQTLFSFFSAAVGITQNSFYDFKLDHWGLARDRHESFSDYFNKVINSKAFTTKDISKWDLSPEGALEFNETEKIYSNVYYFTLATKSTHITNPFNNCKFSFLNILDLPTAAIGCFTQNISEKINIDESWLDNDGMVNTISMQAPFQQKQVYFSNKEKVNSGVWNFLGVKDTWNHIDIIGTFPTFRKTYASVKDIYENHLKLLYDL
ncbi:esterase/lipase family protein [Pigmentibacter ruber]|uniref:esterase/lipase family protein n=1 Tax=Pigmentibacter ruber TaxID=2683196 RepID=UPI00131B4883|nr:lipase [Pigmentibacter ruber]BFD32369.1 lipase [Pigmentibacter ruber]